MEPLKTFGREVLLRPRLLHRANTYRLMQQSRRRALRSAKRAHRQGISVLRAQDAFALPADPTKTCHIVGSGWSLRDSSAAILADDAFVIGNNFACLSGLTFDLYFVEFGGPGCADIAATQIKALDHFAVQESAPVLFKNLWDKKNDVDYAARLYGARVQFVLDCIVVCRHVRFLPEAVALLLQHDPVFLRQNASTVITAAVHARNLGFKRIVFHGLDFGGPYFFDHPDYDHLSALRPPTANKIAYSVPTRAGGTHATSAEKTGVQSVMPYLRDALAREGVQLYAATESSPLAQILPVYRGSASTDIPTSAEGSTRSQGLRP